MKYCSNCGQKVVWQIPEGEQRPRYMCLLCKVVHYQNPLIVAGTLALWEGKILLCKRSIEPKRGLWTLPAGFMEKEETLREAALRETWEEARAQVELQSLYTVTSVARVSQVHFMYLAHLKTPDYAVGEETEAVDLYAPEDIPWDNLSFPSVRATLKHYCEDLQKQTSTKSPTHFLLHHDDLP